MNSFFFLKLLFCQLH